MVNYRTFKSLLITSESVDGGLSGPMDSNGNYLWADAHLRNAWGVLPVNGVTGTITLEGQTRDTGSYTTISLEHLTPGQPFPCYVKDIQVTNGGSVYLLA